MSKNIERITHNIFQALEKQIFLIQTQNLSSRGLKFKQLVKWSSIIESKLI